ncbi:growth hormone secretagogue receptor type 1 [Biomphalaria glabrata]|nr:growth hormone secretagogue receptor type 1 [Biomphalaria glabrata]
MTSNLTSVYLTSGQNDMVLFQICNINNVYLLAIVSLFGLLFNAINICVFVKQGFRDKVNISLFALAVSDIGTLLSSLIYSVSINPLLISAGLPVSLYELQGVVAAFPRATFSRITNCVTTYITFERCMCVVFPIKVKGIITARVTAVTLVFIYLAVASTLIPLYLGLVVRWRFDPFYNRTILGMTFEFNNGPADINAVLNLHSSIQLASFILISLFTSVLAGELRKQSKWRQQAAQTNDISSRVAKKRVSKTIRMIAVMAAIYIVCYSLTVFHLIYNAVEPAYRSTLFAIYSSVLSFAILMESVNSSIGIFLYYTMSAKYRITFLRMFLPYSQSTKSAVSYSATSEID